MSEVSAENAVNLALAFQDAARQQEVAVSLQKKALDAAALNGNAIVQLLEQAVSVPQNIITDTHVDVRA